LSWPERQAKDAERGIAPIGTPVGRMRTPEKLEEGFMQREGRAMISIGAIVVIQALLVFNLLYFMGSRTKPDRNAAGTQTMRPSIYP
jgi:hypothetical protein